jgi:hypothetical protein
MLRAVGGEVKTRRLQSAAKYLVQAERSTPSLGILSPVLPAPSPLSEADRADRTLF